MTSLIKIHRNGQMTLPSRLRSAIGVAEGDLVEATISRGKIVITPKPMVDRTQFPNADDEFTPEQRRTIDAELAGSLDDVEKGRVRGPFETHEAMIDFLHSEVKKAKTKKPSKRN